MVSSKEHGKRSVATLIDSHAVNDPGRAWASIPRNDNDLSKGFVDLTYKQFANAINHASWWLKDNLDGTRAPFETLAYAGPKDLRYPILALAAVKAGKQLLLPSPFATPEAQIHLLNLTKCSTFLHSASMGLLVDRVLGEKSHIRTLEIPELAEWLRNEEAHPFPYDKTWDEGKSDPWLIFHTSGTTGLPKPIVYTNQMMTSLDAAETMPDVEQETMNDHFRNARWYTPLPTLHFVGMTVALQMTVFLNSVVVVGPPGPATAANVTQILEFGNVAGAMLPPSLIEDICRDPLGLERLRRLKYVYFAGAPLPRSVAEQLSGYGKLQPAMGSTEAGAYFLQIRNNSDWDYYSFRPAMGVEFEQRTGELYELVFQRKPELERWQQLFHVYPNLDRFPTKDLWAKHPSEPGLWRYAGRIDDLIVFSHGEDLYASDMEAEIQKHPDVSAALIGGDGRPRPFLIVELNHDAVVMESEKESRLRNLWPVIETANEQCSDYVKLSRKLIIFADPAKPLVRTAKGTISRQQSLALYSEDVERLY